METKQDRYIQLEEEKEDQINILFKSVTTNPPKDDTKTLNKIKGNTVLNIEGRKVN
jgi:hypothetical protein